MALDQMPDEIFQRLLYYVSPEDNLLNFQLLSRRLNRLANEPLLWRYHCRNSFKYWSPDHQFHEKLQDLVSVVNWKELFIIRRRRNTRTALLLDGILATKIGRLKKFEQICLLGYDAKDFLLDQCQAEDACIDVLARR
jgi:F-box protein 21